MHFNQTIDLVDKDKEKSARKVYKRLKDFMFAQLDKDLRDHIDLYDEEVYEGQLPTIRFRLTDDGKILVEKKDEYETRTGRKSPDESDSLALANIGRHINVTSGKFKNEPEKTTLTKHLEKNNSRFNSRKLHRKIKIPNQ